MALFSAVTGRLVGNVGTTIQFISLWNGTTDRILKVKRFLYDSDALTPSGEHGPVIRLSRVLVAPTAPASFLDIVPLDRIAPRAGVSVRGVQTDGTAAPTITGVTPVGTIWQRVASRAQNPSSHKDLNEELEYEVAPGTGVVLHVIFGTTASTPASNSFAGGLVWEELSVFKL